jgi:hypothetical protein
MLYFWKPFSQKVNKHFLIATKCALLHSSNFIKQNDVAIQYVLFFMWNLGFFARKILFWLSKLFFVLLVIFKPRLIVNICNQFASFVAYVVTIYSILVLIKATIGYHLFCQ